MPDDAESFLGVKAQPPAGGDPPLEIVSDSPYRGYGGWLRFFCIVQIFIAPPIALISVAVSMSAIGEVSNRFPSLVFPTVLETIGNLGMIGFGVYAGIVLRRVQLGAVRVAKRYLLTRLLWSFLGLALPYMGGDLPSRVTEAMMIGAVRGAVQTLVGVGIWYTYFNVSKRVRATFPQG